ncbi:MAG: hypothetical protein J6M05_02315 [Cardiobacteriaceae bacterium]|nr:hypothetical protein [Cardiobacteriaceae bacterium]
MNKENNQTAPKVQLLSEINCQNLCNLLLKFGLKTEFVADGADIPGTYWGEPEAGLISDTLFVRRDTPVHSALHEAAHWICMDDKRRRNLHTEAGGTVMEECAVNWLQILLAEELSDVGRENMLADMTAWKYSYREGSVYAWLKGDGLEARDWLIEKQIINKDGELTFSVAVF